MSKSSFLRVLTGEDATSAIPGHGVGSTPQQDSSVACPNCDSGMDVGPVTTEPGTVPHSCTKCGESCLVVRIVSVAHYAVPMSTATRAIAKDTPRTPTEVFSLNVSRGAVNLLAMLWHTSEQTGSMTIELSMTDLAQRLNSTRAMVRRWIGELDDADALRDRTPAGKKRGPRQWELLPLQQAGGER